MGLPTDNIGPWLTALGLQQYAKAFRKRDIDLRRVRFLSDLDLQEMGIPLGPRLEILNAIASLAPANAAIAVQTGVPTAERRHLSILFCDMVASTEYADQLDPEDFRRLVQTFLQTCSEVIRRHHGLVASYIGDAVSAYFGYPVADEDDAERALLAGLEILQTVATVAEEHPLRVRLGVASGQVVVGNVLGAPAGVSTVAFGHVAHLAARLQTLAEPNMILADAATYQAASGAIEFTNHGRHQLKGFAEPIQVWQVGKARPLPSRFARRTRLTKVYGRDAEISRLITSWKEVSSARRGQAVEVSGEAGIGKSRLLDELRQRLPDAAQLMVQCSSAFENSTLHPFLSELKHWAGIKDADAAEEKLRKLTTVLSVSEVPVATTLPLFANLLSIPTSDPEAATDFSSERHRTITKKVFTDWISHLARAKPLLLLLEDEQWADLTSRELLNSLIENLPSIPTLILVSKRTELENEPNKREGVLHLRLSPLSPRDATEIICDMSPTGPPPEDVIAFVLDRAEGVPLFVEEFARNAFEFGLPSDGSAPAGRSAEGGIPNSLQSSLLARLDRLGSAKEIAQIAATIGREFDVELLSKVSSLSEVAVLDELANLVRSGLIVPKEGAAGSDYCFKHALLQQAAQGTILRERRQRLHARISEAMEARDPNASSTYPEVIAQHFADAGLFERAADYWLLAGLKAGKTWAKVDAAEMFGKGIEAAKMLPDTPERNNRILRLELERGDVLYAAFGYMTREGSAAYHRAIRLSEELGDPEAPVRALDGLFGTHFNSGQFSDAINVSDRLIELGEDRNDVKALVLGLQFKGISLFSRGQLTSARLYLERALEHKAQANEVGSDFPSMAMIYLAWTMHILGNHEEALNLFREAETIVRQQTPYRLAAWLGDGCILFAFREESDVILRLADELLPLAQENGFNLWAKMAHFFRGWATADIDGSLGGTDLMHETVRDLEDQEVDKSCFLGLLGKALLRTGQLDKALEAVQTRSRPVQQDWRTLLHGRAASAARRGRGEVRQ